jgi:hypothetical protein
MTDPPFEENYYKTKNSLERHKNKKIFFPLLFRKLFRQIFHLFHRDY